MIVSIKLLVVISVVLIIYLYIPIFISNQISTFGDNYSTFDRKSIEERRKKNIMNKNIKIPKIIHQTIKSKTNIPFKLQKNIDYIKKLNPSWEYRLYDDNDIDQYIRTHYSERVYKAYFSINPKYGPAKADLFRYLVIYREGGVYLDIKSGMLYPLDEIISENDEYILSYWGMFTKYINPNTEILGNELGEIQQWHVICIPRHPALKKVIDNVLINIEQGKHRNFSGKKGVLFLTGPIVYSYSIGPLLDKYNFTIYNSHKNAGLIYNNIKSNHTTVFKNHYSKLSEPVIL
jgi:mannosyltransferase OCH1-like enzyme